jgi:hypothetical protein
VLLLLLLLLQQRRRGCEYVSKAFIHVKITSQEGTFSYCIDDMSSVQDRQSVLLDENGGTMQGTAEFLSRSVMDIVQLHLCLDEILRCRDQ